jgi:AcrR family transcriptional regulator
MSKRADKKKRILHAAEIAFAEEGSTFSLRTVTAIAEVNVAAVNYYFGSKSQLMEEMAQSIAGTLNSEQLKKLSEIESLSISRLIEAFTVPFFLLYSEKEDRKIKTKILGKLLVDVNAETRETFYRCTRKTDAAFMEALKTLLPELPEDELNWRYRNMIGLIINNLGKYVELQDEESESLTDEKLIRRIVHFCSAGLSAPSADRK